MDLFRNLVRCNEFLISYKLFLTLNVAFMKSVKISINNSSCFVTREFSTKSVAEFSFYVDSEYNLKKHKFINKIYLKYIPIVYIVKFTYLKIKNHACHFRVVRKEFFQQSKSYHEHKNFEFDWFLHVNDRKFTSCVVTAKETSTFVTKLF